MNLAIAQCNETAIVLLSRCQICGRLINKS